MTCRRRLVLLLSALICGLSAPGSVANLEERVPIRYKINSKQTECLYQHFAAGNVVTFSVFVVEALNNGKPKAAIQFEGPVAGNKGLVPRGPDDHANEDGLQSAGPRDMTLTTGRTVRQGLMADWPRIKGPHAPSGVIQRKFKVDWTHAGESEDAAAARAAVMEQTHEEMRRHSLENKDKPEEARKPPPLLTQLQTVVAPYEETTDIKVEGWYRLCVTSDFMPLVVEMDLRNADEMQGIDPGTGHVFTYQRRDYLDEQQAIMQAGEGEAVYIVRDGHKEIRARDLKEAKIKLQYMHELTSHIMKTQHERMHRMRAHDADARRGAVELARTSKLETLLFVMITGVQVYTVHKWLLGNPQLGK